MESVAPPALQFNPQPVVEPVAPPALQFNPQPAGDWAVDASGDPFAQAPAAPVAPPAPAPEPAPAVVVASFERVLLPMFEALLGERRG